MDSRIFLLLLLLGCAAVYTDKLPPSKGIVKPGNCPTDIKFACQYPITAEDECKHDGDCKDEKKCCKACVMSCLKPEFKDKPRRCPVWSGICTDILPIDQCQSDQDCKGNKICCNQCGMKCV